MPAADPGRPPGRPPRPSRLPSAAPLPRAGRLRTPAVILAADHRARGVATIEPYADYLDAIRAALPHCDGILATSQPLGDLAAEGAISERQRSYLSLNRTGLAGSVFELDDRLVTSVARAAADGWTGVKHMTRIDPDDPQTAGALELLGRVLDDAAAAGLEALIEAVGWSGGRMARDTDTTVRAAVIAHDMGAPVLKVPVPEVAAGPSRVDAVGRIVSAVGCPVLFLGGPRRQDHDELLSEAVDVMAGGGAGLAIGRGVLQHHDPGKSAAELRSIVHGS